MSNSIRRLKLGFYGHRLFRNALFHYAIVAPFLISKGLSQSQVLYLESIFWITKSVLEVPLGYAADIFGRRTILIAGTFLYSLVFLFYGLAWEYPQFAVVMVFAAIAHSLCSGADSALVADVLHTEGQYDQFRNLEAKGMAARYFALAISVILGGFAADWYGLSTPVFLTAAALAVAVPVTYLIPSGTVGITRKKDPLSVHAINILRLIRESLSFRLWSICIIFAVFFTTQYIGYWALQFSLLQFGFDIKYYGIIFASLVLISTFFSYHIDILGFLSRERLVTLMLFALIVYCGLAGIALLIEGWVGNLLLLIGYLLYGITCGIYMPFLKDWAKQETAREGHATIFSIMTLSASLLFAAASALFGNLSDVYSLSWAFFANALLVTLTLVAVLISGAIRRKFSIAL